MRFRWWLMVFVAAAALPAAAQSSCQHQTTCGSVVSATLDFAFGTCLDSDVRRYDLYSFQVTSGQIISILVRSSFFPPAVLLLDDTNTPVARDENPTRSSQAGTSFTALRGGTYTVAVRNIDVGDGGPYTLQVGCSFVPGQPPPEPPPPPPIALQIQPSSIRVIRGSTYSVAVVTKTNDFEGPVSLEVKDVPAGMRASIVPSEIPFPGEGTAELELEVTIDAAVGPSSLSVVAEGGEESAERKLYVDVSPSCRAPIVLGTQPGNHVVFEGARARLAVDPSGTGPFAYQWYEGPSGFRSSPVRDATSRTLVTPPVVGQALYWVEVRNICGVSASATAMITTVPPPPRLRPVRR